MCTRALVHMCARARFTFCSSLLSVCVIRLCCVHVVCLCRLSQQITSFGGGSLSFSLVVVVVVGPLLVVGHSLSLVVVVVGPLLLFVMVGNLSLAGAAGGGGAGEFLARQIC